MATIASASEAVHGITSNNASKTPSGNESRRLSPDVDSEAMLEQLNRKLSHVHISDHVVPPISHFDDLTEKDCLDFDSNIEDRNALISWVKSNDIDLQLRGVVHLRKYLSVHNINHRIDIVLSMGLMQYLVSFLEKEIPLLQYEVCWILTNIAAGDTNQTRHVVDANAIPSLVALLHSSHSEVRTQAAWTLGNIAGDGPAFRDLVVCGGIVRTLLQIWCVVQQDYCNSNTTGNNIIEIRILVWLIANICRGVNPSPHWELIIPILPLLRECTLMNDVEVLGDVSWALSRLLLGLQDSVVEFVDSSFSERLIQLLGLNEERIVVPTLRALTNIASSEDQLIQMLLDLNLLPELKRLLRNESSTIRREVCLTLSNIVAGKPQHVQAVIDMGIVPILVEMLGNDEMSVRREICWIVSNATSTLFFSHVKPFVEAGVMPALISLLERCDHPNVIRKCLDSITHILKSDTRNSVSFKSPHGTKLSPFLQHFSDHEGPEKLFSLYSSCINSQMACTNSHSSTSTSNITQKFQFQLNSATRTYSVVTTNHYIVNTVKEQQPTPSFSKHSMVLLERIQALLSIVYDSPPPIPTWNGEWPILLERHEAAIFQLGQDIAQMVIE